MSGPGGVPDRGGVTIVVVNYGSHTLLTTHLREPRLDGRAVPVVVVDNPTTPADRAAITALVQERGWQLLPMSTNVGFGTAMNAGVRAALTDAADTVLMVNPDLELTDEVIAGMVAACREQPGTMVSPRIFRPDGTVWFAGGEVRIRDGRTATAGADSSSPTGWLTGACLGISAELWQASGGFDDDYFLYWEDVDLSWRCLRAGGRLRVLDELEVTHDVGGTQGPGKSAVYLRYNARNRLVFAAKHLDGGACLRWVLRSPTYARLLLRRAGATRALHRHTRELVAILDGTVRGVAFLARRRGRRRLG